MKDNYLAQKTFLSYGDVTKWCLLILNLLVNQLFSCSYHSNMSWFALHSKGYYPATPLDLIKHPRSGVVMRDTGSHHSHIIVTIAVSIEVGIRLTLVNFYFIYKLGADVIVGCYFCVKHVEAIRRRQSVDELDDGTTFHIMRYAVTKTKTKNRITEAKIYAKQKRPSTGKIIDSKKKPLEPESKTLWIFKTPQAC